MDDDSDTTLRVVMVRADHLIDKLEREQYNDTEGANEVERAERRGWNSRARDIIAWLRDGRSV